MPLSATLTTPAGIFSAEPQRSFERDLERVQIAIVDADDLRAGSERGVELLVIVNLHQRGHAVARGEFPKIAHLRTFQDRRDQQNRVGAVRGGFDHVQFVDGEILAQNRDRDRGARRFEIRQTALEKFLVGQDAQRGGAAGGIHACDGRRIESRR